jgi:hypothetical protein
VFQAIKDRESEIRALESQQTALNEPVEDRLAVIPSWVCRQLEDTAGLLSDVPERVKIQFQRLGLRFTLYPIHDEGPRPFLRAEGSGEFERLAFAQFIDLTTTVYSHQGSHGSRTFVLDLPANQIGPGWRRKAVG